METPACAEPWACPACTYRHTGPEAGFLQCAMCGGTKTAEAAAPAQAPAVTPAPAPAPTPAGSSGAASPRVIGGSGDAAAPLELASSDDEAAPAPPRKREREEASTERPPPKRNAFAILKREPMAEKRYTVGEFGTRIRSRGSELPAGVRVRTFPVDGLFLLEDMLTADDEGNAHRFVEPLLRAGNHVDSRDQPAHRAFGPGNRGGLPCKMNRRAQAAWRGTEFADTHKLVPLTGPSPPAEAPPPIPDGPLRDLARRVQALRAPGEQGKALVPQTLDLLLYEPGGQIGPHSDDPWSGPTVCIFSLCSDATMTFTWKGKAKEGKYRGLEPVRVRLPRRSLLVFTGDARTHFNHSIEAGDIGYSELGHRISITFRATTMPDEWSKWRCQPDGSCTAARPCALCKPPWL